MFEKLFLMFYTLIPNTADLLSTIRQIEDVIAAERYDERAKAHADLNQRLDTLQNAVNTERSQLVKALAALAKNTPHINEAIKAAAAGEGNGNIIKPVKELRYLAGQPGLKATKDAVELVRDQYREQHANIMALREKLMGPPDCEQ